MNIIEELTPLSPMNNDKRRVRAPSHDIMSESIGDASFVTARSDGASTPKSNISSYASMVSSYSDDDKTLPSLQFTASGNVQLSASEDEDGNITPTPKPMNSSPPTFGSRAVPATITTSASPPIPNITSSTGTIHRQRSGVESNGVDRPATDRQPSGYSAMNESTALLSNRSGDLSLSGGRSGSPRRFMLSSQLTAAPIQPVHTVPAFVDDEYNAVSMYRSGFSKKQKLTLLLLCMTHFCLLVCYSLIAPFFPTEVIKKGSTATMSGMIFSCFQLAIVIAGPVFGSSAAWLSPKTILIGGVFTVASTYIAFGFLDWLPLIPFIAVAFALRAVEGFGSGAYQSAAFSICAATFGDSFAFAYGIMSSFLALGLTVGPVIGGLLYTLGGFGLPFWAFGSLFLVINFIVWLALPGSGGSSTASSRAGAASAGLIDSTASMTAAERQNRSANIFRMLLVPGVLLDALTQTASFFAIAFYQSVISLHVWPHVGHSELGVSLVILTSAAMEGITAPIFGWLIQRKVNPKIIMLSGYGLNVVGFMLMGPSPLFKPVLTTSLVTILMGTLLHGIGCGAMGPIAIADIVKEALRAGYPENHDTFALCSGVSTSMMALGALFGPLAGGLLHDTIGFAWGATALAALQLALGTCFALNTVCRKRTPGRLRGYSDL